MRIYLTAIRLLSGRLISAAGFFAACGALQMNQANAADVLCYRARAFKASGISAVRIFRKACPRGFSLVPNAALAAVDQTTLDQLKGSVGSKGTQGDSGAAGIRGPIGPRGLDGISGQNGTKGDAGVQGALGARGVDGEKGAQGAPGLKGGPGGLGNPGDQGDSGPQGDTGPKGPAGLGSDVLFKFSGSTGAETISPNETTSFGVFLQPNSVQKPTFIVLQDAMAAAPLLATSCSKISYFAELEVAPGLASAWQFSFAVDDPSGSSGGTVFPLCSISDDATSCAGTVDISASANSTAVVAFKGSDAAILPTKAHWVVRCLVS